MRIKSKEEFESKEFKRISDFTDYPEENISIDIDELIKILEKAKLEGYESVEDWPEMCNFIFATKEVTYADYLSDQIDKTFDTYKELLKLKEDEERKNSDSVPAPRSSRDTF